MPSFTQNVFSPSSTFHNFRHEARSKLLFRRKSMMTSVNFCVFSSDFILVQFTFASYFCIDPLRTTALKRETQTHSVSATFLNKVGLSLYQSRYFCPALFKLLNSEQYHNEPLNRLNRKQPSLNCSHICFFLQWRIKCAILNKQIGGFSHLSSDIIVWKFKF